MTVEKAQEWKLPQTPADLATTLESTGYLPDDGTATAAFLALRMHRLAGRSLATLERLLEEVRSA